jgi:hypothetical protein
MKITLKNTPEQVELVKAMASRNRDVAYEAQTALAEFIGPVLAEVINNAPALSNLFTTLQYNADDNPSIPLDLYYDVADEGLCTSLQPKPCWWSSYFGSSSNIFGTQVSYLQP